MLDTTGRFSRHFLNCGLVVSCKNPPQVLRSSQAPASTDCAHVTLVTALVQHGTEIGLPTGIEFHGTRIFLRFYGRKAGIAHH